MGNRKIYNTERIPVTCVVCVHLKEEMAGVFCSNRPDSNGKKVRMRAYYMNDICPAIAIKALYKDVLAKSIMEGIAAMVNKYKNQEGVKGWTPETKQESIIEED